MKSGLQLFTCLSEAKVWGGLVKKEVTWLSLLESCNDQFLSLCLSLCFSPSPPSSLNVHMQREGGRERKRRSSLSVLSRNLQHARDKMWNIFCKRSLYQWSSDFIQLLVTDLSLIHKRKGDKKGKLVKSKRYSFNYSGHLFFKFVYIYNKRQWIFFDIVTLFTMQYNHTCFLFILPGCLFTSTVLPSEALHAFLQMCPFG